MKIIVAAGTRPELIKLATLIREGRKNHNIELIFCFTGQHYDYSMSQSFVEELELPPFDYHLGVGSATRSNQIARIIARFESVVRNVKPNMVVVQGDTNSALGTAMCASMMNVPVAHVEAGCRSHDRGMPEEINRILISDIATLHFAPTSLCLKNLLREGIASKNIYLVGHPLIDLIYELRDHIDDSDVLKKLSLEKGKFYLCTVHRQENTDYPKALAGILRALHTIAQSHPVVLPLHPRTRNRIESFSFEKLLEGILVIDPLRYIDMLNLIKNASLILTDSGGIQQEAAILGTYCVTLRTTTEWSETVMAGINFIVGNDPLDIIKTVRRIERGTPRHKVKDIFGKPGATRKIINILLSFILAQDIATT